MTNSPNPSPPLGKRESDDQSEKYQSSRKKPRGFKTTFQFKPPVASEAARRVVEHANKSQASTNSQNVDDNSVSSSMKTKSTSNISKEDQESYSQSIAKLLAEEKYNSHVQNHNNADRLLSKGIMRDGGFVNDSDYMDEYVNDLSMGVSKGKAGSFDKSSMVGTSSKKVNEYDSELMKRGIMNNDYNRLKKALDGCPLCISTSAMKKEDLEERIISAGQRVYLTVMPHQELNKGHCRIVPMNHLTSLLDMDEDTWEETKNYIKTLIHMFHQRNQGVVFYEIVTNVRNYRHTYLEAVPVPYEVYDELPGLFHYALDESEQNFSQHQKRIRFSARRPFLRALVPQLPYFAVFFDYKGEDGYGHVIEGVDDSASVEGDLQDLAEKGGGHFKWYFAQEIIGNALGLSPNRWRHPQRYPSEFNPRRVAAFRKMYGAFDWTQS